jgi:hypothetical protein
MPADVAMSDLSTDEIGDRICELSAHIAAATYRWLRLLSEFDKRRGWAEWGVKSFAHWLSWRCGISIGPAREKIRVARALDTLPRICEAFSRGELSYSKVRAITRIATPETEQDLLVLARSGTTQHVEKIVRGYRRCLPADALDADLEHERRYLEIRYDDDGSMIIRARLPREEGALVLKAIEKRLDEIGTDHRVPGSNEGSSRIAHDKADALVAIARAELQGEKPIASSADRYQVIVHADVEAVRGNGGMSYLEDGAGLASETVRRLLCDCSFVGVVRDSDGSVLDLGRKARTITPAQRRALNIRDDGCVFPGCTNKHYTDGHHLKHWIAGGDSDLENLALLCAFHHRLVHEGGFTMLREPDGSFTFFRPDGRVVRTPTFTGDGTKAVATNIGIDKETAKARWGGEPCDYSVAINALMRKRNVSAETFEPVDLERAVLAKNGYDVVEEPDPDSNLSGVELLERYGITMSA